MRDGAPWIAHQVKQRFGSQGSYLVDFYHVCDYQSDAVQAIESQRSAQQQLAAHTKDRLKTQRLQPLLNELQSHLEPAQAADEQAPVRRCYRYLSQRPHQLDYEGALRKNLPIGSGEIESAHRYLVQKRRKLPGSWWAPINAEQMLARRVSRENKEWPS